MLLDLNLFHAKSYPTGTYFFKIGIENHVECARAFIGRAVNGIDNVLLNGGRAEQDHDPVLLHFYK